MTDTQRLEKTLKDILERLQKLENQISKQGSTVSSASKSAAQQGNGGYVTDPTYYEALAQINDSWEELDGDGFLEKLYRTAANEPEDSPFEDRDAELRWWDKNTGYYLNAFPFLLTMDEESTPWLLIDQALAVRKDFYALGMLTSGEGILTMYGGVGWGPDGFDSNPFVWLGKGGDYGDKDYLEIRRTVSSAWGWGGLKCGAIEEYSDLSLHAAAEEKKIRFLTGLTEPIGFYGRPSDAAVGMYDWQNSRDIWTYYPADNKLTIDRDVYLENIYGNGGTVYLRHDTVVKALFNIDSATPTLNLDVSGVNKGFFAFDGTDTYLTSASGIALKLSSGSGTTTVEGDLNVTGAITSESVIDHGASTTLANGTKTITFTKTFTAAPDITVQTLDASAQGITIDVTARSTTQFTVKATVHKHKIGHAYDTASTPVFQISTENSHTHDGSVSGTTGGPYTGLTSVVQDVNDDGAIYGHDIGGYSGWVVGTPGEDHYHDSGEYKTSVHSTSKVNVASSTHTHGFTDSFTTTSNSGHTHTIQYASPGGTIYVRSFSLRDINGDDYGIGAVLTNEEIDTGDIGEELWTELSNAENDCREGTSVQFMWQAIGE